MNVHVDTRAAMSCPRAFVGDLAAFVGRRVRVCGWAAGVRRSKDTRFLTLRDRTGLVQVVHHGGDLDQLPLESALRIEGMAVATPGNRFGPVEVHADTIEIVTASQAQAGSTRRADERHLDLRAPERQLVFHVQTTLLAAARTFLMERGFLEIQTPKITAGGSESGASVFKLPYFGETACLVQSPQFYVQLAMAAGLDRVFEVGPAFRAEAAETNRHATEFTSFDVELSWVESHHDLMTLEENLLRHVLSVVAEAHGPQIERTFGLPVELLTKSIPRIPYATAVEIAGDAQGADKGRMTHRAEQALSKYCSERHGHSFVFITDYPSAERSFYTMRDAPGSVPGSGQPQSCTRSFDLIWRGLEITSGCQREHRHDRLLDQARAAGLEPAMLARYLEPFYLPMFRHGCPPHGGFGIGINRLLMALLGQSSIRDTSFVFRGPGTFRP